METPPEHDRLGALSHEFLAFRRSYEKGGQRRRIRLLTERNLYGSLSVKKKGHYSVNSINYHGEVKSNFKSYPIQCESVMCRLNTISHYRARPKTLTGSCKSVTEHLHTPPRIFEIRTERFYVNREGETLKRRAKISNM